MWGYSSGCEKRLWLLIDEEHEGGGVTDDTSSKQYALFWSFSAARYTFKILDLVKPIMFLASRLKKKKKSRADAKAVKTALKLWAVVYHDITNA
jgi:hypothetical protein